MSGSFWRAVRGVEAGISMADVAVILLTLVTIVVLSVFIAPGRLSRIEVGREKAPSYAPVTEGLAVDACRPDGIEARSNLDTNHALKTRAGNGAFLTIAGTVLTVPQESAIPKT